MVTLYKPGDIVVWKLKNNVLYLVLEINLKEKEYRLFILNHTYKEEVGERYDTPFDNIDNKNYILLKDKKL